MGMPALAMTDHGNVFGRLRLLEAGAGAGVKPIIGIEAYVAPGSRFERSGCAGPRAARTTSRAAAPTRT
jgi:DNA polymerase III alpha subunit